MQNYTTDSDKQTDIMNVSFTKINSNFSYGYCGKFNIIIMNSNGYVNADNLCINTNKQFADWLEFGISKKLIAELKSFIYPQTDELMITITDCTHAMMIGTYVNPYLIPHIALWASPAAAIKVSKIINEYFIKQIKTESDLDSKINELLANQKMMMQQINNITETKIVSDDGDQNACCIVKINGDKNPYAYYVIKTKKNLLDAEFNKLKIHHKNMVAICTVNNAPQNAWLLISNELKKRGKIVGIDIHFNLINDYNEERLIKFLEKFVANF